MEYSNITYFWGLKGAYLAPLSILISAFIGAAVAIWAIKTNRAIARMKNSMDFINGYSETEDIAKAIKEVQKLKIKSKSDREKMATPEGNSKDSEHIRIVLNYYESMAVCIHNKIYDNDIIKQTIYTTVVNIFNICKPYILETREQRKTKTYFQELEVLVKNWEMNPLKDKTK